ncbi:MAG: lipopolysaccharide kinase InaA family protein [Lentisphaerota bacterium]
MEEFQIRKSFLFGDTFARKVDGIPNFKDIIQDLDSLLDSSTITKNDVYVKAGVFELSGSKYFIKRYSPRNIFYKIGYLFKQIRAEHSWFASLLLDEHSIANPKSYLVCSKRKFGFIRTSYLITEAVSDIFSISYFKETFGNSDKSETFYAKVIKQLASVHNAGIFHSDAKLWNFYAYKDTLGQEKIGIWDLDGAVIYKELPIYKRVLDLSRTIASIIELNREVGFDVYNSTFIDRIASSYEKYSNCRLALKQLESKVGWFLAKKKIYKT